MRIKRTIPLAMIVALASCFSPALVSAADTALENMRSTVGNSRADLEKYRNLLLEFEKTKLKANDQAGATAAKIEILRLDREIAAGNNGSRRASRTEDSDDKAIAEKEAAEKAAIEKDAAEKAAVKKAAADKAAEKITAGKKAAAEMVAAEKAAAEKAATEKAAAEKAAAVKATAVKVAAEKAAAEKVAAEKAAAVKVAADKAAAEKAAAVKVAAEKAAAVKVAAEKVAAEKAAAEKAAAEKVAAEKAAAEKTAAIKAAAEKVAAEKAAAEKAAAEKAAAEKTAAEKVAAEKAAAERIAAEKSDAEMAGSDRGAAKRDAAKKAAADKVAAMQAAIEKASSARNSTQSTKEDELKDRLRKLETEGNTRLQLGDIKGARDIKFQISVTREELARLEASANIPSSGQKPATETNSPNLPQPAAAAELSAKPAPVASASIKTPPEAGQTSPPVKYEKLEPILHSPKTYASSVQGLAGTPNFSKDNIYTFSLPETGSLSTLTYYAIGLHNENNTFGTIWLITPDHKREKIGKWKSSDFNNPAAPSQNQKNAIDYKTLTPISLDISGLVKEPGNFRIEFEWTDGVAPLVIYRVELTS